ncbi:hypothetical protein N4Q71_31250, partial [Salmonella enterica subsp. enterica serovar Montevideo]
KMQSFVNPCPIIQCSVSIIRRNSGHYRYPDGSAYPDVAGGALTPYQSSTDLCQKLQRDGLVITDVGNAWKVLERCSYYRFKAYLIPFCDETTRRYYPDELLIKRMSYICLIRIYGCWLLIDPKNRNCRA